MTDKLLEAIDDEVETGQRAAILRSWAASIRSKQKYESTLTSWLDGVAEALEEMILEGMISEEDS